MSECDLTYRPTETEAEVERALSDADRALLMSIASARPTEQRCFFCRMPTNDILQICAGCREVGERLQESNAGLRPKLCHDCGEALNQKGWCSRCFARANGERS